MASSGILFKQATEAAEFQQIHALNYRTFVEEIPQHPPNAERLLRDRFHADNTYLIGMDGEQLAGMLAVRDMRPFSLDKKFEALRLGPLETFLPPADRRCEVRLLSVALPYRHTACLHGLMDILTVWCHGRGCDQIVISATTRQLSLYTHIGFVPFGPRIGTQEAYYQPMVLTKATCLLKGMYPAHTPHEQPAREPVNLLPGPVAVLPATAQAWRSAPQSHRSEEFRTDFKQLKQQLCETVNAQAVQVLLGSGTLANDVAAGQISLWDRPGLILSNGEFGERLIDHAERFQLRFEVAHVPWGSAFDPQALCRILERAQPHWLWAVHCETSTGVLNDLSLLKTLCSVRKIVLCMDCISSVGTLPVDLSDVALATCVSGKGLRSYAGLACMFHSAPLTASGGRLPRYLDGKFYENAEGIPFTHSSNLCAALQAAMSRFPTLEAFAQKSHQAEWLRHRLRVAEFQIVAPEASTSPAIITLSLPEAVSSESVGLKMEAAGYLLSYRSDYLQARNWIQIVLMGDYRRQELKELVRQLQAEAGSSRVNCQAF